MWLSFTLTSSFSSVFLERREGSCANREHGRLGAAEGHAEHFQAYPCGAEEGVERYEWDIELKGAGYECACCSCLGDAEAEVSGAMKMTAMAVGGGLLGLIRTTTRS